MENFKIVHFFFKKNGLWPIGKKFAWPRSWQTITKPQCIVSICPLSFKILEGTFINNFSIYFYSLVEHNKICLTFCFSSWTLFDNTYWNRIICQADYSNCTFLPFSQWYNFSKNILKNRPSFAGFSYIKPIISLKVVLQLLLLEIRW